MIIDMSLYKNRNGKECTPAQYLAETIVLKQAEYSREKVPNSFWQDIRFKNRLLSQIVAANVLLKIYSPECIVEAIRTYKRKLITLRDKIFQEHLKILAENKEKEKEIIKDIVPVKVTNNTSTRNNDFGSKNKLKKLD